MNTSDNGPEPYVADIEQLTLENENFRTTIWTGKNIQLTVMTIPVGSDIGLEIHHDNDQFLRIEQGRCRVEMGPSKDSLSFVQNAESDWAIFVPAGTWHNITNTGDNDLKLYTVYGPAHHLPGTVHETKQDAENDPND
jgi:mannose-6-phosphate isomerase-like protein (cupin superfamily)